MLRESLLENQNGDADHRLSALVAFLSQEIRGNDLAAIREKAREYGLRVWSRDGVPLFKKPALDGATL